MTSNTHAMGRFARLRSYLDKRKYLQMTLLNLLLIPILYAIAYYALIPPSPEKAIRSVFFWEAGAFAAIIIHFLVSRGAGRIRSQRLRDVGLLIKENMILGQLIAVVAVFFTILLIATLIFYPPVPLKFALVAAGVYSFIVGVGFLVADIGLKIHPMVKGPDSEHTSD